MLAGDFSASQHAPTLTALHEQPIVTYAIAGNIIGRSDGNGGNGLGFSADGESYTLTKTDVHAVCYPINTQIATRHEAMGEGTGMGIAADGSAAYTLQSAHSHAVAFGVASSPDRKQCARSGASKADKPESTTYIAQPEPCICSMIPMGDECPICGFVTFNVDAQPDEMRFNPSTSATSLKSQHSGVHRSFQIRRLTPEECESLQGFPRGYTNVPGASDTTRYRALGNSMATNVMEYIATRIDIAVNYAILNS